MRQGHHVHLACALTLLSACGSHDGSATPPPTHTVQPEPHVAPPTPPTPPSTAPPTPAAPTPTAPTPAIPEEPTGLPVEAQPIASNFHFQADIVTLPDAAASAALARRIKADAREMLIEDGNVAPREFDGVCTATLAQADLVSYDCGYTATVYGDREDMEIAGHASFTYTIDGATIHASDPEEWLVVGADAFILADDACRDADEENARGEHRQPLADDEECVSDDPTFALSPTGLEIAWGGGAEWGSGVTPGHAHVEFAELGKLVRRDSVLTKIAGALDHASERTPLADDAAPPPEGATVTAFGDAATLDVLAARWGLGTPQGVLAMLTSTAGAPTGSLVARHPSATTAHALGDLPTTTVPLALPMLRLTDERLRRAMPLRSAPRGGATVLDTAAAGTELVGVVGRVGDVDSDLGAGLWAYVVMNESTAGWVPAGTLQHTFFEDRAIVDSFLASVPDAEREQARTHLRRIGVRAAGTDLVVLLAPDATGAHTRIRITRPTHDPGPVVAAMLDGTVTDVRPSTTAANAGSPLVLVALHRATLPAGTLQWQAYRAGDNAGTAVLDVALPTDASLPNAQRAQVRAGVQRGGQFYPFVVRGPGRAETPYSWNGSALAPPAAPTGTPTP